MAQFASDSDILEYEPDIKNYGIQDFSSLHEKTYDDLIRLLNIKWWPTANYATSQFTRAAVYHVLYQYIYPRLSTFEVEGDAFREKMAHYKEKFAEEFDSILQVGVNYDLDSSGTFSDAEKQSFYQGRLIR